MSSIATAALVVGLIMNDGLTIEHTGHQMFWGESANYTKVAQIFETAPRIFPIEQLDIYDEADSDINKMLKEAGDGGASGNQYASNSGDGSHNHGDGNGNSSNTQDTPSGKGAGGKDDDIAQPSAMPAKPTYRELSQEEIENLTDKLLRQQQAAKDKLLGMENKKFTIPGTKLAHVVLFDGKSEDFSFVSELEAKPIFLIGYANDIKTAQENINKTKAAIEKEDFKVELTHIYLCKECAKVEVYQYFQ